MLKRIKEAANRDYNYPACESLCTTALARLRSKHKSITEKTIPSHSKHDKMLKELWAWRCMARTRQGKSVLALQDAQSIVIHGKNLKRFTVGDIDGKEEPVDLLRLLKCMIAANADNQSMHKVCLMALKTKAPKKLKDVFKNMLKTIESGSLPYRLWHTMSSKNTLKHFWDLRVLVLTSPVPSSFVISEACFAGLQLQVLILGQNVFGKAGQQLVLQSNCKTLRIVQCPHRLTTMLSVCHTFVGKTTSKDMIPKVSNLATRLEPENIYLYEKCIALRLLSFSQIDNTCNLKFGNRLVFLELSGIISPNIVIPESVRAIHLIEIVGPIPSSLIQQILNLPSLLRLAIFDCTLGLECRLALFTEYTNIISNTLNVFFGSLPCLEDLLAVKHYIQNGNRKGQVNVVYLADKTSFLAQIYGHYWPWCKFPSDTTDIIC